MRKKKYAIILICILLAICIFTVACVDNDAPNGENTLAIEYISSSNIIMWKANWADKFDLTVYYGEDSDGFLIYSESGITSLDNHRKLETYIEQSGKYFIEVIAYNDKSSVTETLIVEIEVESVEQYPGDDYQVPTLPDESEGFKSDVGRLKKVYYHLAKSDDDLSISLANQNGIKSVSGFTLSQYGDWSYDKEDNLLIIDSVYLNKFSSGANLQLEVEYNDGRSGDINIGIVDELPMDIIKGGLTITSSQIYSNNINGVISILDLLLNYDIFLGYGREVASQGSAYYIKYVSIDGKKLLSSAYACYSSESKITLTANKTLSGLSYGMHLLEIYTTHGKSEVWLNVKGKTTSPNGVIIDYDSSYPNIYIKWDMLRDDASHFVVRINDKDYSSLDYPQLFDKYSFDATDKINYGDEVRVTAFFDEKGEQSLGATLDVNIDNRVIQDYLSYDKNSFVYLGTTYNMFIDNYDELKELVFYSLIHYDSLATSTQSGFEKMWRICVNPSLAGEANSLEKNIEAAEEYFNEGVKSKWKVRGGNINIYEIHLTIYSTCIPSNVVRTPTIKENPYNNAHISSTGRSSNFDDFAVNSYANSAEVVYSEELYRALERGLRPVPKQGSSAQVVYDKAKTILRTIIDDSMNDYQKVHAIVDWLSCYVTYNWALADELGKASASSDDYNKYYAYRELYLEGAILDGLAVCNGYAKAVSLLCGIEGIKCYKVKGASGQGVGFANPVYAQHAWNKVYIDGNWYVLDSTWANEKVQLGNSNQQNCEVLKHNTLFMTDEQSGNRKDGAHYETYLGDYSGYFAGSPYDIFANTYFMYDGNIYDMVIDDEKELKILLNYIVSSQGREMGRNTYLTVDVRCDNTLLNKYIDILKKDGLELFNSYSITTKHMASYGNMTSLVFWKQ